MRSAAALQAAGAKPGSLIDQITRDAIRRASMAPTYMEALDITGAALIAVAAVVRMESRRVAA
jgi:hypothetical protein